MKQDGDYSTVCTLDADPQPALGSGYDRLKPVMPRKPMVPKGAPAELRLDAKKEDVIPLYPY